MVLLGFCLSLSATILLHQIPPTLQRNNELWFTTHRDHTRLKRY